MFLLHAEVSVSPHNNIEEWHAISKMTGFLSVLSSLPLHKIKQDENENEGEVEEQTFKEKELDRKLEDVPPDILSNERYTECVVVFFSTKWIKIVVSVLQTLFVLIFIFDIYLYIILCM